MVNTRFGVAAALLAATIAGAGALAAAEPDLSLKTEAFLEGPGVIAPRGRNLIYTPTAPQNGKLIIVFPGPLTGKYESFMTTAAAHGYHVLALDSPLTEKGWGDLCPPEPECHDHLLRQAVDGDLGGVPFFWSKEYPQSRYPQGTNAVIHRLVALLEYLKHEHQGSGQFLVCRDAHACEPDWPKIVVAGHGSGSAVALWLLQRHHGSGMKALVSSVPPGSVALSGEALKNDVTILDTAGCPSFEDKDAARCAWGRFLQPY